MTLDNIDYVERDYDRCIRTAKPRLIKARMSSFGSIADRFNNFRIKQLEKKLEKMKNQTLEGKYTNDNFSKKLDNKSKAIAKLEEKIMILAKEDVPTDYVSKRAIKLKKAMIANLTHNSGMFYTIGLENKNEVFENDLMSNDNGNSDSLDDDLHNSDSFIDVDSLHDADEVEYEEGLPEIEVVGLSGDDNIEVVPSDITRQTIADVVNAKFDGLNVGSSSKDDEEVIEEYTDNGGLNLGVEEVIHSGEMSKDEVRAAIEDAFKEVEQSNTVVSSTSSVVDDTYNDAAILEEVDNVIDKIRVSRNNVNSINPEKFDENGDIRPKRNDKYHYVPMTDEEIRESQRKLGFDEHGNLINGVSNSPFSISVPKVSLEDVFVPRNVEGVKIDSQVRDNPVIVEDRKGSFTFGLEEGENMFDVIDVAENDGKIVTGESKELTEYSFDDSSLSESSSKLDDYHSLKDKILQLQRQKQISHEKKVRAEKVAEEKAEKAQEVKRMFEESQKTYEQSLDRLRAYTESLEEECERNSKVAEIAENDAQMSENFIALQQQKADDNYRVIREIDGLINGDSEVSVGGRAK